MCVCVCKIQYDTVGKQLLVLLQYHKVFCEATGVFNRVLTIFGIWTAVYFTRDINMVYLTTLKSHAFCYLIH